MQPPNGPSGAPPFVTGPMAHAPPPMQSAPFATAPAAHAPPQMQSAMHSSLVTQGTMGVPMHPASLQSYNTGIAKRAEPKVPRRSQPWFSRSKKVVTPRPAFSVSVMGGTLAFFFTLVLFTFYSFYHWQGLINLIICSLGLGAAILYWQSKGHLRHPMFGVFASVPIVAVLAAIILGAFLGTILYNHYGRLSLTYAQSRIYENVVPSTHAAAYADAGRLLFSDEVTVDTAKSVGYAADDGNKYCVAPVRDATQTFHVEFWAVGTNCCGWKGEFSCDAVGDQDARAAAVVMDSKGYMQGDDTARRRFEAARRKAIATFGLAETSEVMFVRWLPNSAVLGLPRSYKVKAWIAILVATSVYGVISGVICWMFLKMFASTV